MTFEEKVSQSVDETFDSIEPFMGPDEFYQNPVKWFFRLQLEMTKSWWSQVKKAYKK